MRQPFHGPFSQEMSCRCYSFVCSLFISVTTTPHFPLITALLTDAIKEVYGVWHQIHHCKAGIDVVKQMEEKLIEDQVIDD